VGAYSKEIILNLRDEKIIHKRISGKDIENAIRIAANIL
jgi:hypothetical protein